MKTFQLVSISLALGALAIGCGQKSKPAVSTTASASTGDQQELQTRLGPVVSVAEERNESKKDSESKTEKGFEKGNFKNEFSDVIKFGDNFSQASLKEIFLALTAEEVSLPMPDDILCEYIRQIRLEKKLGRLTCLKQYPDTENAEALKLGTSYTCSINTSSDKILADADKALYDGLKLEQVVLSESSDESTFEKRIGDFSCTKTLKKSGDSMTESYSCKITEAIFQN